MSSILENMSSDILASVAESLEKRPYIRKGMRPYIHKG